MTKMNQARTTHQHAQTGSKTARPGFCKWLRARDIKTTLNFGIISFELKLSCKTLAVVAAVLLVAFLIGLWLAPSPAVCAYGKPNELKDDEAIIWLIRAEGDAAVSKDLTTIKKIFAPNATIVDHSPVSKGVWLSPIDRYRELFVEANFQTASHFDIKSVLPVDRNTAYYVSGSEGTYINIADGQLITYKNPPNSDHWTLEKLQGCWVIKKLDINAAKIKFPD